jgi:hypothetical protein
MLLTRDVLFVHAPKTAGMAVTEYLIANLPGAKIMTLPPGHERSLRNVTVLPGRRHENLAEAVELMRKMGRSPSDLKLIHAVFRNPYELEVSRYHYYRLGHPWDRGRLQDLEMTGVFDRFCREALYPYIAAPLPIETYYTLDGVKPPANMRLLRQERLEGDLDAAVSEIAVRHRRLKHVNVTEHAAWTHYITPANEPFIFDKYRWLFQFYERMQFPSGS